MNTVDWSAGSRIAPAELPALIRDFLASHEARDTDTAITSYAADAVVTDDGHTYRGRAEIRAWLDRAASEYTYTTELVGAARIDEARFEVVHHLEGDFPGGVVDLRYRFTLNSGLIGQLTIAP